MTDFPVNVKPSARKQAKDALSRIDALEKTVEDLQSGVANVVSSMNNALESVLGSIDALVEIVGPETVAAKIAELKEKKDLKQLQDMKDAVAAALEKGTLVVTDSIQEKTLVIGQELDAEGKPAGLGRVQLPFEGFKPKFQEQILGKPVGTDIDIGNGGKVTITEIYKVVDPPPATDPVTEPVADPKPE